MMLCTVSWKVLRGVSTDWNFRGAECQGTASADWSAKERSKKLTSDAGVADVDARGHGRVLEDADVA